MELSATVIQKKNKTEEFEMKRLCACVLCLVLLFSMSACHSFTRTVESTTPSTTAPTSPPPQTTAPPDEPFSDASGLSYTVNNDGVSCTVTGIGSCELLAFRIGEEIDGYTVTAIGGYAFANCKALTLVELPNTVRSIYDGAFAGCEALRGVIVPDSVISIGYEAFAGCKNLLQIALPDSVKVLKANAFDGCERLETVRLSKQISVIEKETFQNCKQLTSITLPDCLTEIALRAFYHCESLKALKIPFGVHTIQQQAFANCISLHSIDIPDSVTKIYFDAFQSCSALTMLEVPDSVTKVGSGVVRDCTALRMITLPALEPSFLMNLPEHTTLSTLLGNSVPSSLKTVIVTGGATVSDNAFRDCHFLTCVKLNDSIQSLGKNVFGNCTSLWDVELPEHITELKRTDGDPF